ncbi:uncharacterized protein V6R79_005803 [Siganus canaliculatus]
MAAVLWAPMGPGRTNAAVRRPPSPPPPPPPPHVTAASVQLLNERRPRGTAPGERLSPRQHEPPFVVPLISRGDLGQFVVSNK